MSDSAVRRCQVMQEFQPTNPDPIKVEAGEPFHVSEKSDPWDNNPDWIWIWCTDQRGKSDWVPKTIIQMDKDGQTGTTNCSYDATVLTIAVGDELTVKQEESGWLWCVNAQGEQGWVPISHVKLLT